MIVRYDVQEDRENRVVSVLTITPAAALAAIRKRNISRR